MALGTDQFPQSNTDSAGNWIPNPYPWDGTPVTPPWKEGTIVISPHTVPVDQPSTTFPTTGVVPWPDFQRAIETLKAQFESEIENIVEQKIRTILKDILLSDEYAEEKINKIMDKMGYKK